MTVYQYVVLLQPTDKEKKAGKHPEIVVNITSVVAKDVDHAKILAIKEVPDKHMDSADRLEVLVRPF